jgi:hypothetical protein
MGYGISGRGITRLRNYEQALEWYNNTPPIKGNGVNAGMRPLGDRNKPTMQIIKGEHDDGEFNEIKCRLYQTDVIIFYPNGSIIVDVRGHHTVSTATFVSHVLHERCRKEGRRLIMDIGHAQYSLERPLQLRHTPEGRLVPVNVKSTHVHRLNRKAMNAVRKEVAEFKKFYTDMLLIRENMLTDEENREHILNKYNTLSTHSWIETVETMRDRLDTFMEMIKGENKGNWYLPALWLAFSGPTERRYNEGERLVKIKPSTLRFFDELLMAAHPHVLDKVEVPAGTLLVDRYRELIPFIQHANNFKLNT